MQAVIQIDHKENLENKSINWNEESFTNNKKKKNNTILHYDETFLVRCKKNI